MADVWTIINASPRTKGKSAQVVRGLADRIEALRPSDEVVIIDVARASIAPCVGCDSCRASLTCTFRDDMDAINEALDRTDKLIVASPVYFAGPPAKYKALLDRLQPHYWANTRAREKRPLSLFVLGEGGDPHGYDPLVVCTRSAFAVAGFSLVDVVACVGGNVADAIARGCSTLLGE